VVDRSRVRKRRDQVRLEKHDIRAGPVRLKVPSTNAAGEVVLSSHLVSVVWLDLWTHRTFALESSLHAR
jgi:hypothetical protein